MKDKFYTRFYRWYMFKNMVCRPFWWLHRKSVRSHRALVREALQFEWWDYTYLLELEKKALEYMVDQFEKRGSHVYSWVDIRDMKWCINLIDIITERTWLIDHDESSPDRWNFTRPVNTRNVKRFADDAHISYWEENSSILAYRLEDYYITKAWALYCKIKQERMRNWWD